MSDLLPGLSGYIPIKNNYELDYCAQLGVRSLLPVCDEVIVVDAGSTDKTLAFFEEWAQWEPKLRIVHYDLPRLPTPDEVERDDLTRPPGNPVMLIPWLNAGRAACRFNTQITLDADETLAPIGAEVIKQAIADRAPRWFRRINLWPSWVDDSIMEAPHGTVCGERVVRMGPTAYPMHSDEPCPEGEPEIRRLAVNDDGDRLKIYHLGFLRDKQAFLRKSRIVQGMIHNTFDPRLRESERTGREWYKLSPFPENRPLLGVAYDWPDYVNEWIKERGWKARP